MDEQTTTKSELTDNQFWDDFWAKQQIPARIDPKFSFERCLGKALKERVPQGHGKVLLEVGCAPGRWMVFFHDELGYRVEGIEYVASACRSTRENLKVCGVNGDVIEADFLNYNNTDTLYDVVSSFGFIEHFQNLDLVLNNHIKLLKPGGILVLGVPNFRGVNNLLQGYLNRELLDAHNVSIMKRSYMRQLGEKYNLQVRSVEYLGGFEPAIFGRKDPPQPAGRLGKVSYWFSRKFKNALGRSLAYGQIVRNKFPIFDRVNNPLFSSYILATYQKR